MEKNVILNDLREICASPLIDWHRFAGKRVLVTGASGMLPSYVVLSLLEADTLHSLGLSVTAQVRNASKARDAFGQWADDSRLTILQQDVCEEYKDFPHVDFIVHAASQASPKYYSKDPVGTLMANVKGTANVLELARRESCESVLFFSSAEVYGTSPDLLISEDSYGKVDPVSVRSCYAESKRMGEQMCSAYNLQYGTHAKSVRPFHTYGPNMKLDDGRVFADFVNDIVNGRDIVLRSTGEARRAFCYVTDATTAFIKVLLDGVDGTPYNVGNPDGEISVGDLASLLVSVRPELGLKRVFDIDEKDRVTAGAVKCVLPDVSRMKSLGWQPSVGIREGFTRVIDHKLSM